MLVVADTLQGTSFSPAIAVSPDHCIAHLKLLEAFYQLREDVGNTDDVFGIPSPDFDGATVAAGTSQNAQALAQIKVREKRWAVYVARAVDRFYEWWDKCVPTTLEGSPYHKLTSRELRSVSLDSMPTKGMRIRQLVSRDHLPPLGKFSRSQSSETLS
jgi:hypothetical protein